MRDTSEIRDALLQRIPGLEYELHNNTIRIPSRIKSGFDVSITDADGCWIVGFNGWHEQFDTMQEALNCVAFGLSDRCRLEVSLRGDYEYKWTVQSLRDGEWVRDSTTSLILIPFWSRRRVEYRQNT